ncbi:hypothetical protein ACF08M_34765 [Streptomyces sp. NPDC015032]|uniref:hypothetical protein n=1 Tax=Streptomyces sp. NPDC015032 TaxID=3364937 RepID=UPI0036FD263E
MPDLFRRGWQQPASGQMNAISSGYRSAVVAGITSGRPSLRLASLLPPFVAALAFMSKASVETTFACTLSGCVWDVSVHFRWFCGC